MMINLKILVKNSILIQNKLFKNCKEKSIFIQFLMKKIFKKIIYKILNYIKRYVRNSLKLFLSYLYRFGLHSLANKLLYLYRLLRRKNYINYDPELKIYNNITMNRLDYNFKYSKKSQAIFQDLKSSIKNTKARNM